MNPDAIKARVVALLAETQGPAGMELQNRLYHGATTVLQAVYGRDSSQERDLRASIDRLTKVGHPGTGSFINSAIGLIRGTLQAIEAELASGFVGSLQSAITADVLSDLVKLSRAVFEEAGDAAKNVAAVLAAAAFEDCLRRLSGLKGLPHQEKLADVVTALKDSGVLQGAQVGVAQSYLSFRNRALHAKWTEIDRPEVSSILGFTEELLIKHFA